MPQRNKFPAILIMAFLLVIPPVFTHQRDKKPVEIRQAVVRNNQNPWRPEVLAPDCFTPDDHATLENPSFSNDSAKMRIADKFRAPIESFRLNANAVVWLG